MEPIRVLQCFTILNRGGAETMIMNYYRNIDRTKVQFDFLVHRDEIGEYEQEIKDLGGRIYRLPPIHPLNYFQYKKAAREFLLEHPEYKIIHGHFSELGYWFYKEASRQQIHNIIVHAHNYPNGIDAKSIFRWYWKHKMRKYVTHYFSCSNNASEWLFGKKNAYKAILMNNAIETELFVNNEIVANKIKEELNITDKFIIGHVGRFNDQKNHDYLIDIFFEFKKIRQESMLLLVGIGSLQQKIREKVKSLKLDDSVIFLNSRSDVYNILQVFDVFVFPSKFEGLPVSVVEAQAAGIPCVLSDAITTDVKFIEEVEFLSLSADTSQWINKILKFYNYRKKNQLNAIKDAGYDIQDNVHWLAQYYMNLDKESYND